LEMEGDWESFFAGRPGKVRKAIRRVLHQVESAGPWEVSEVREWEGFLSAWEGVRTVAERSWTHAIGDSLATPVNAAFFRELAQGAAALGELSLWLLRLSGRTVAFEFHLRRAGTEYALRACYDQGYAELSPGTFLETQMLKSLFQGGGGVRRLDFGGSFDRYKKRWCDKAAPHVCLTIFGDRMLGRLAAFHELETVRVLRALRDKLRDRWQPAAQREES
ncbi:GNAT family N-acetyltransferase, partial [Geomonas sp.]|uniref:GNAT family N-acetyltransferase n=1 Tax=Geomonas sp. TaxID=2651584 RepID=UPI002B461751